MTAHPSEPSPRGLPLDVLVLDSHNPRLPAEMKTADQNTLLVHILYTYDAIAVARSIAWHGYFESEPLIVIPHDHDTYLVVEGNRRLVALKILADPALAEDLDDADEWRELAEAATLPDLVPVVVARDRQDVVPIIGYRHISGIEPWEPYAKARFIASLVDDGMKFQDVANLVGEAPTSIANHYRNRAIVRQAEQDFGIDASRVVKRFGVFTRAMNSTALRAHIAAPAPSEVSAGAGPLPQSKAENVRELFSWLFGDDEHKPVIDESRNITELGTAVASEDGLAVLRSTRDLEAAYIAAGGLRDRLLRRLNMACTNLEAASEDMPAYGDDEEVQQLLARCREALQGLSEPDAES
jgi:hypothetical protein